MSHFSVIVTGDNIEAKLQPYHEFECTGTDDQYIQDVDKTEEARESYMKDTTRRIKDFEGKLHCPYGDEFYRVPTEDKIKQIGPIGGTGCNDNLSWTSRDWGDGKDYSSQVRFVPDGWEEVEVLTKDIIDFREWAEGEYGVKTWPQINTKPGIADTDFKYGYILLESTGEVKSIIKRTNPNKTWDWWQVGGRYSSRLILKTGKTADSAIKGDIDYEAMSAKKVASAADVYDRAMRIFGDTPVHQTWEQVRDSGVENCRDVYWAQPRCKAWKESDDKDLRWESADDFLISREQYLKNAANQAYGAFAFLHDGEWTEKGSMGWFGCVSNETSDSEWYAALAAKVKSLPDDTLITIVDCHI